MDNPGAGSTTTSDEPAAPYAPPPPPPSASQPPAAQVRSGTDPQRPFQDMPAWIWKLFFACWLLFFASFVLIFGVSANVRFVLGVVVAFAIVFFCTPLVLLRLTRRTRAGNARRDVDIPAGRRDDLEAAIQIVLLPVALTLGLIVIGANMPQ